MFTSAKSGRRINGAAQGRRGRLLTGAGSAALALTLALPSTAWARDYTASTDANLRQAILDANADSDARSTITLTGHIALSGSLPASTKQLVIDTAGFTATGMSLSSVVTVSGTTSGVSDTANGTGQAGLDVTTPGGEPATVTNNVTVADGDGTTNSSYGPDENAQSSTTLINNSSLTGGKLRVNGTPGHLTSVVNVSKGGTLGGSGTIGGDVNVTDGILAPGNSPGTLTIAGNLLLASTSILDYEFGQSNLVGGPISDLIEVGGDLTLDGTINVTVTPGGEFGAGVHRVLSYGGSLTDNGLTIGTTPGGTVQAQTAVAGQVNLVNYAGAALNFWDGNGGRGDNTITGGTGVWQASTGNDNWTLFDGSINSPYTDDNFAIFLGAAGTVTVDNSLGAINASGMQFATDGYMLTGGFINMTAPQSIIRVGDGTAAGLGYTVAIATALFGIGDLVKTDLGTLVLTGPSGFDGDTYVRSGALQIAAGGTLSNVNGVIGPDAGNQATVTVTGAGSTWTSSDALVVGYDGNGRLNVTGGGLVQSDTASVGISAGAAGNVLVSGIGSSWHSSGDIVLGQGGTGNLRVEGGATVSSRDSIVGSSSQGTAVVTGAGSSWTATGELMVGRFATGTLRIEDGATVTSDQGYIGSGTGGHGTVNVLSSTANVSTFTSNQFLMVGDNGEGTLVIGRGGVVRTSGFVVLANAIGSTGTIDLTGDGSGRGVLETGVVVKGLGLAANLNLDGGILRAARNETDFLRGFGALTIGGAGAWFDSNGYAITVGTAFDGAAEFHKLGLGALSLTGDSSYSGGTFIEVGTLSIGNGSTTGSITGPVTNDGELQFNRSNTLVFTSLITGSGDVRQAGSGATILNGNNSYSGLTYVTDGTLLINGNQSAATGLVTVGANGTLGGTGTIGGSVDMLIGGTLAAGSNSPGTLTIAGNLNLGAASLLDFEFGQSDVVGGPLNDLIDVGGNLTLDGTLNVAVTPGGSFDVGVYRIMNYGGALTDNGLSLGVTPAGSIPQIQTAVAGQVNLVNFAGSAVNFWDGNGGRGDNTITGGTGVWQAASGNDNWTLVDGTLNNAYSDGNFAVFMGAAGTVTVDTSLGAVNASGMQFVQDGYVITGGAIGLSDPASIIRVGDGTAAGAGYTATIESDLTGVGDLVKTDFGTLVLTGASSFAGAADMRSGTLRIANGGTLTTLLGTIAGDAGSRAIVTVTGTNGGGNASTWTSDGMLTIGNAGTGTLNVTAGGKVISGEGSLGSNSGAAGHVLVSGAGSAWNSSGRITIGLFGTGDLRIEAGGQISSSDGIVGDSALGQAVVTGAGSLWANAGQFTVGSFNTGSLRIENGAGVTSNQGYVGAGAGSTGTVVVNGAGSNWLVDRFNLTLGNFGNGTLAIENGGLVRVEGGVLLGSSATGSGTLTLTGTAANRAVLETSGLRAGAGAAIVSIDGGLLRATGNNSNFFSGFGARDVTLGTNGGVIDTNGHNIGIAPRFVGTGGLIKDGTGRLILSGANSYAGATLVNAGTLWINGNQSAATGLTSVAAGATLGGIGIIGGSVDMSAGGTLAPGNSPGTLTINGNLLLGAGTQLNFELGQANVVGGALNDLVNVGGNLTLDGTLNVTESAGGSFGIGIYRLFNYGGGLTNNGLTIGVLPAGGNAFVQTGIAGQVNLVNTGGATLNYWDGAAGPKFDNVINGGTGIWQNSAGNNNWTDASGAVNAAFTDNAVAIFGGSAGTVTVDNGPGAVGVTGMQFATTGYVITGGAVTLTGPQATIRVGDGTVAGAGHTATIASALTGASQLVLTDLGTLILTGTNSYAGGTRIDSGTLQIGNGGATGSITGDIVNNAALVVNRTGTLVLDGAISGSGTLTKLGGGTLILTGSNSYAGGTTIGGGTVQVSSDANLGAVAGTLSLQGGMLRAGASFTSNRTILLAASNQIDTQGFDVTLGGTIGNGPGNQSGNFLDKLGSGTLTLTGANSYANRTLIAGGTLALSGAGTIGAGNLIVAPGTVFDISQTNAGARIVQLNSGPAGTIALGSKLLTLGLTASFSDWSGTITDGGIGGGTGGRVVITAPAGAVRFFEANSYTGGTTIASGTLELNGNGALYAGGALTINTGLFNIAGLAGAGTTIGDLSGSGSIALGAKSLTLGTANDSTSFAAISGNGGSLVKAGSGTFVFAGGATHTGGTTIAAGTLQLGNGSVSGSIAGDIVNNGTLAFNRAGEQAFNGVISGSGAVTQIGGGTTILTGANSYAGITTVSGGTLRINGDQSAATGLTRVLNGGTLGGAGTIGGSVTVADGGTLAPGNSPGTLTIAGNLALSAGSRLAFEFGQANLAGGALNDLINVGGNLTLDGTIDVTESAGGSFGPGVFRIINYTGTLTDNGLSIGTIPAGSQTFVQTAVAGQVNLVNTAGLTLGFWDGVSGPKNDGAIQGGAGIWRVNDRANNWTTATGAINADYAQDSFAVFTGTGATVTIDNGNGNVRAAGMQFTVNGYTLTGGPLELTGTDAFVRVGDGSAGDGAITATIASALTGSARLVKDMGGTLSIASDANLGAVAGGLSFNGGTLRNTAAFASSRTIDLVGAGTLFTDAGLVLDGIVSGAGALAKDGAGTLVLTADNSYAGGTTIAAGMLQLGSGGTSGSITGPIINNAQLAINRSNALTLGGVISGNGELLQTGTGTTVLTAANSYTGATRVSSGTLLINGNQSAATGLTVVAANATLGGTGTIGGSVVLGDGTLAPGAGGAGTLTINGNLAMAAGSRLAVNFGAANAVGSPLNDLINIGGNLTLDGTIDIAVTPGGSFDIGLYRVANYGGTVTNNGLSIGTMPAGAELFVQTSVNGQVNLVNTGSAVLNFWDGAAAANKFNNTVDGGSGMWRTALDDSWADATGAVNAPYDNGAFAIFTGTGGTVTIDNSLGAVTASGLQFAANGYRIQGGALTLTGPQSVIRVGDGTNGGSAYTATIDAAITGTTQLVKTDLGQLVLTGTNSYTGGTAINGGTLRIANDANLGAAAGGLSFNGGTLSTASDISSARAIVLAGQGVLATDAGTTLTLTGGITGTGLLGKTGTGTLVLAGTGSHSGGIDAVQGMLLVNGNYAAATGPVTIRGGAALGGTGTIGGDVSLAGTLTPGSGGAGTLTINGSLTIGQTATLAYEFGQANVAGGGLNDLVNVAGNLTLDGTINVTVPAGGNFSAGIYRVFNYGGTLTDNGLSLGAMPAGSNVGVQTAIAGQVNLVNFAGLALNFWDGATGPKNNGVVNGGTGVWQHSSGNNNWTEAAGLVNAGYSDGAFAVFGGTAGTVTVDNSLGQVTAGGMQFATGGYTITGGGIALTGGQASIRVGDGSTAGAGYTATINTALSGTSELVKTDAGTLVLGGANSYTGGTRITGGTVQIAGDANLGAAAGGVTFDGGTLATTATLSSARNVNLLGAGTLSTANGTVFTLGGVLSGTGALTKAGGGTLVLTGNSGGYTGATSLTGGTLAVMGVLGGAVDVRAGTRLEGIGSVGSVTNAGTVAPGRDGFGTLTINGSYTGANGTLAIDVELGGDASRADRLVVNGATAGTTVVQVTNQGGLGAATVDGIKIVDVTGASNGVFTLGNSDYLFEGAPALIAGAYGYRLYKNGVTSPADGDWYLRSSLLQQPEIPLYQPGVPVYEAYGQTLSALNRIGTMQERTGNRQWAEGNARSFGIWGRSESQRARPEAARSTSFTDVNIDSWKIELGADQVLSERADGTSLVLGVLGSYGEASATIASPFGNGRIKTQGYSAGATLSWFGPQGFYVDGRAQVSWFDSKLTSSVLGKLADGNKGTGQAYSLEVGKRAAIGGGLSVTPQIQTVYSTVGFDRFTDPNDAAVSSKLGDSLRTRWGVSLDRQDGRSHVYAVVNLSYEWLDGTITDVSGTRIARENHRLWGELGVGGSLRLGSRLTLYSEVSADTAVNDFGKSYTLKGVAGLRMAF